MEEKQYIRYCSECNKKILHSTQHILNQSIKKNRLCKSCCQKSNRNANFGKRMTTETKNKLSISCSLSLKKRYGNPEERKKQSLSQINRYINNEERYKTSKCVKEALKKPNIRKKHLNGLHNSQWLRVKTDKGQLELIEKWNRLGFKFEPNYQIKTDIDLFYIDGYDKENNVVLEYDGKYHNKPYQQKKDLIRQQKIIKLLKPIKFWRYNSITNQVKNILE